MTTWKANDSSDKKFENAPAGAYNAVCIKVIDLGTHKSVWEGQEKIQRKVHIMWEIDEPMSDGRPFVCSRKFTVSLHEKASLRAFLKGWRGRDFTEEELLGFDPIKLIAAPCMLSLVQSGDYVNVASASKLPKGMATLVAQNKTVYFSLDDFDESVFDSLSNSMRETIQESPEYKKLVGKDMPGASDSSGGFAEMDSDIPF